VWQKRKEEKKRRKSSGLPKFAPLVARTSLGPTIIMRKLHKNSLQVLSLNKLISIKCISFSSSEDWGKVE
jgi:hypothetical protein